MRRRGMENDSKGEWGRLRKIKGWKQGKGNIHGEGKDEEKEQEKGEMSEGSLNEVIDAHLQGHNMSE